jgi:DNA-binding NarL/FixJ family response regulator
MYQNIRIIIADDHELMRKSLPILLKKQDEIEIVDDAENGKELIEKVREHKPDVVVTDIQMPIMDGIKATRKIKEEFPDVKVLALTMFNEDHLIVDMLEAGAKGYLLKNTTTLELTEAIKAVYNGGTHFCNSTSEKLKNMIVQSKFNPYKQKAKIELTAREIEVMRLMCQQMKNTDIADKMCISVRTVEGYREKIFEKTGSKTLAGITIFAIKNGYHEI